MTSRHVVVKMENGRELTYETDLPKIRVGTTVEVPPPYWMEGPQWGKVVSLTSDFEGDLVRIRRIVSAAEAKAARAARREAQREAKRLEDSKPPWNVERREDGYVICRGNEGYGGYYKVEGMAWNTANRLNEGKKNAPKRPSYRQSKRDERERVEREMREKLDARDEMLRRVGSTPSLRNFD